MKSKPQFILALHASGVVADLKQGVNPISMEGFFAQAQSLIAIREREHLEKDPTYRQVIPT